MSAKESFLRIRRELLMDQKELGLLLGLTQYSISHYENGTRKPKLPTIRKLLEICKMHKIKAKPEDFFDE